MKYIKQFVNLLFYTVMIIIAMIFAQVIVAITAIQIAREAGHNSRNWRQDLIHGEYWFWE